MDALLDIRVLTALAVAVALVAVLAVGRPALLLPGAIALGVLLTRPSAVGERVRCSVRWWSSPPRARACCAPCASAASTAVRSRGRSLLMALAWVWLGLHALLAPGSEPNLGTSTITVFLPVMAFYFVVRDPELLARVRTALVGLVVGIAALVVVALAVIAVVGPTATLVGNRAAGLPRVRRGGLPTGRAVLRARPGGGVPAHAHGRARAGHGRAGPRVGVLRDARRLPAPLDRAGRSW